MRTLARITELRILIEDVVVGEMPCVEAHLVSCIRHAESGPVAFGWCAASKVVRGLCEPERQILFRVQWVHGANQTQFRHRP